MTSALTNWRTGSSQPAIRLHICAENMSMLAVCKKSRTMAVDKKWILKMRKRIRAESCSSGAVPVYCCT